MFSYIYDYEIIDDIDKREGMIHRVFACSSACPHTNVLQGCRHGC
jgi:hypothetical protein